LTLLDAVTRCRSSTLPCLGYSQRKICYGFRIVAIDRRIHGEILPYEVARDRIAERLQANVEERARRQYVSFLAGQSDRPGVVLNAGPPPLVSRAKPDDALHASKSMRTLFMRLHFQHGRLDDLKTLHPAYFALVMATGIVSIATYLHGIPLLPTVLLCINVLFLGGLTAATGARVLRYPRAFAADIQSHSRGVGFFTTVAATAVFGTQLELQMDAAKVATAFWIAAVVLWFVTTYGVLAVLTVKLDKPSLAEGLNGGWLVSVVASQSVAILTVLISASGILAGLERPLLFVAIVLWLGGGALYLWIMTLIFFRYTFVHMTPDDLTPSYWINMGAVAISTLAGATLVEHAALSPVIVQIVPFAKGLTLFFWAIATWWIPLLLVLSAWRYLICGAPIAYDPLYWAGVFPLGMYSVSTYHLAKIVQVPPLLPLSQLFMVVAVIAWAATFAGLIDSRLNGRSRAQSSD
jgi:tellurite resistance protein TehA-like permease